MTRKITKKDYFNGWWVKRGLYRKPSRVGFSNVSTEATFKNSVDNSIEHFQLLPLLHSRKSSMGDHHKWQSATQINPFLKCTWSENILQFEVLRTIFSQRKTNKLASREDVLYSNESGVFGTRFLDKELGSSLRIVTPFVCLPFSFSHVIVYWQRIHVSLNFLRRPVKERKTTFTKHAFHDCRLS